MLILSWSSRDPGASANQFDDEDDGNDDEDDDEADCLSLNFY